MGEKSFDASRFLTNLGGRDYLEVKWRLLWLRTEHPEAIVATELVKHEGGMAIFKAQVSLPNGGEATGWGSETVNDFEDYIEKAETKALGRACAALGYGTQFCEDFAFHNDKPLGVESQAEGPKPKTSPSLATEAQVRALYSIAKSQHGWTEEELNQRSRKSYHRIPAELTRKEASEFIDSLRARAKTT